MKVTGTWPGRETGHKNNNNTQNKGVVLQVSKKKQATRISKQQE
jgi:hypothetical protein